MPERPGLLFTILALLISGPTLCQEYDSPFGKGKKNRNLCARVELGWNRSWFTSLGVSYVYSNINKHSSYSVVVYSSVEANIAGKGIKPVFYAYKAGIEAGGLLFAYGAELRNNTDFSGNNHFVFTPKVGISLLGHVNLFYGYNIFNKENNIFGIGRSQLSLNVNLNRKIFKESLVPKE